MGAIGAVTSPDAGEIRQSNTAVSDALLIASDPLFATVLHSRGPRLVKRWHLVDGKPVCEDTENAARFCYRSVRVDKAGELAALLRKLTSQEAIIPGCLIDGLDPADQRRIRKPGGEHEVTVRDRKWIWFPFDLDSLAPLDDAGEFDPLTKMDRTLAVVTASLPAWAHGCATVIQFTGGHGLKSGIRGRAFVRLSRGLSVWEMAAIAERDCEAADMSLYQPERLIYCGPTVFEDGVVDPVTQRVVVVNDVDGLGAFASPPPAPAPAGWEQKSVEDPPQEHGAEPFPYAKALELLRYISPWGPRMGKGGWLARLRAVVESNYTDRDDKRAIGQAFMTGIFYGGTDQPIEGEHRGEEPVDAVIDWSLKQPVCGIGQLQRFARAGGWAPSPYETYGDPSNLIGAKAESDDESEDHDDGGPHQINTEALDDRRVPGDWVAYAGDVLSSAPAIEIEIIPGYAEKSTMSYDEGGGGAGKSYIAEQESACVSAGHPVLGREVVQTGVLYLNYEEPREVFDHRLYQIKQRYGEARLPDGRTFEDWKWAHEGVFMGSQWPRDQAEFHPLDTSRLLVRHLKNEEGAHLLRVTRLGKIIITRFGRQFLDMLARRRDQGQHTFVVFDGLIDAILFEGSTRSEDDVVRQVIALLDRWCAGHDFTGRGIIHPSRAGERLGTASYAPAWTTKPRIITTYKRIDRTTDKAPTPYAPAQNIVTRRTAEKRSHGVPGGYIDMQYINGVFQPLAVRGVGGEDAVTVATQIALRYDGDGCRIKKDGTIGTDEIRLTNQHQIIVEYRRRTGAQHGVPHFLGALAAALEADYLVYRNGRGHTLAGYAAPPEREPEY
jgi:hypothetical protein